MGNDIFSGTGRTNVGKEQFHAEKQQHHPDKQHKTGACTSYVDFSVRFRDRTLTAELQRRIQAVEMRMPEHFPYKHHAINKELRQVITRHVG